MQWVQQCSRCCGYGASWCQKPIPCDEVIGAMYRIGLSMSPNLKETARGGLAATPTGKAISRAILGNGDLQSILKAGSTIE